MIIKNKKILFTGGGSAGHVTPNLALSEKFLAEGWSIFYIGSKRGLERKLVPGAGITYYPISTGKLRRYFSWQNFLDPIKIVVGIIQALFLCRKLQPEIVFSKGGFVSFPVVVAAWVLRIPVIIHEADLSIGLANKLCFPFATKICVTFPETSNKIKNQKKAVVTGIPVRAEFLRGDAKRGREFCGFDLTKKILLVFGGSGGAETINKVVRDGLPDILTKYQVVHVCGENKVEATYKQSGYKQFAYLQQEFPDVLAAADLVISRAGANSIYELIIMRKLNILLPLGQEASRGDQLLNAQYCLQKGFSEVIMPRQLTTKELLRKIELVEQKRESVLAAINRFTVLPSIDIIYQVVLSVLSKRH